MNQLNTNKRTYDYADISLDSGHNNSKPVPADAKPQHYVSEHRQAQTWDVIQHIIDANTNGNNEFNGVPNVAALPAPPLALIYATLYSRPETRKTAIALASSHRRAHHIIRHQDPRLTNLFAHIARGQLEEAQAILTTHPALALQPGYVTDDVGRYYERISPLEYALWIGDSYTGEPQYTLKSQQAQWAMVKMIRACIKNYIVQLHEGITSSHVAIPKALVIFDECEAVFQAAHRQMTENSPLTNLLLAVAYGEQEQAEAILARSIESCPGLLFDKGYIKDNAGRLFHLSAFELALWAGDFHLWGIIHPDQPDAEPTGFLNHLKQFAGHTAGATKVYQQALEQTTGFMTQGCRFHGHKFDVSQGLAADNAYIQAVIMATQTDKYNVSLLDSLWLARGKTQRILPAHTLQLMANFSRPTTGMLPNYLEWDRCKSSMRSSGAALFPLLGNLGQQVSFICGARACRGGGPLRSPSRHVDLDRRRVEQLYETIDQQKRVLSDYLERRVIMTAVPGMHTCR